MDGSCNNSIRQIRDWPLAPESIAVVRLLPSL
jgi:hypothetical protein